MPDNELELSTGSSGPLHEAPMCVELADEFGLAPKQVIGVLRNSIIKVPKGDKQPTAAELVVVLSVMRKLNANPMLGELHAWRDNKGEICVMAGYDLWAKKASEQPGYQGVTYELGPECPSPDGKGKSSWEWIKPTVHDSIRGKFEMFPVYLNEWYVDQSRYPRPWQKQTKHKFHIVAFRAAIREFYNLGGLDLRDPEDFLNAPDPGAKTADTLAGMAADTPTETVFHDADATYADTEAQSLSEDAAADTGQSGAPDVPCGASGCPSEATVACLGCGAMFCGAHTDAEMCGVCQLDGA